MTSELMLELRKAATSAFEQLGFFLPDQDLSEEQSEAEVTASSRVRFRGPRSGVMEVVAAGPYLAELASNMLGDESAPSPEMVLDALGEISNVICGNVLPSLGGQEAVFDLSAPDVRMGPPPPSEDTEEIARVLLGVDQGRAEITIRLDS